MEVIEPIIWRLRPIGGHASSPGTQSVLRTSSTEIFTAQVEAQTICSWAKVGDGNGLLLNLPPSTRLYLSMHSSSKRKGACYSAHAATKLNTNSRVPAHLPAGCAQHNAWRSACCVHRTLLCSFIRSASDTYRIDATHCGMPHLGWSL